MRATVLGMGKMGHAVAKRLVDGGHEVTVWNRSPEKADDLVELGASRADSVKKAAEGAEVVAISLSDDAAVLSVAKESGLVEALGSEAILVDMSTVSPDTAVELGRLTEGKSLASPILGAPQAVEAGKAVYLVAGPKGAYERVSPFYEALSEQVRYLGEEVDKAPEMKLLANYLLLGGLVVLAEMVSAGQAVGLGDDVLREFLDSSPLVPEALRNRIEPLFTGEHEGWFSTFLGAKDMRLASELAKRQGLRLPVAELVKSRYEEAASSSYADSDLTAVIELTRKN